MKNKSFLNSRNILGTGLVTRITCEDVRKNFQVFYKKQHLEDKEYEAAVLTHILVCPECIKLFNEGAEKML